MPPKFKMNHTITRLMLCVCALGAMATGAYADMYINVMAVNGAEEYKETAVRYNLPGDLNQTDILDTSGLNLDYDVNNGNYFVFGTVALEPKKNKTYRIRVRDVWKIAPEQLGKTKDEIEKGFEQIGRPYDPTKAELLKKQLLDKIDFIQQQQTAKADTIEKRIDAYRAYRNEMLRINDYALSVDYWRSEPGQLKERVLQMKVEVFNPKDNKTDKVQYKSYLPAEVRPKDIVEPDTFEIRFDQKTQQAFLFKEDSIPQGQTKTYNVGILDIWFIEQKDLDYLRKRANDCWEYLKDSKYLQSATYLYENSGKKLTGIEDSQKQTLSIKDHINLYRVNQQTLSSAESDVENLEKLLAMYREELEKTKVKNVLQKIKSLKGVADISQQVFGRKPAESKTWNFIGIIAMFLAGITVLYFVAMFIRSSMKPKQDSSQQAASDADAKPDEQKK